MRRKICLDKFWRACRRAEGRPWAEPLEPRSQQGCHAEGERSLANRDHAEVGTSLNNLLPIHGMALGATTFRLTVQKTVRKWPGGPAGNANVASGNYFRQRIGRRDQPCDPRVSLTIAEVLKGRRSSCQRPPTRPKTEPSGTLLPLCPGIGKIAGGRRWSRSQAIYVRRGSPTQYLGRLPILQRWL
jgi:hypothetical protein